MSRAQDGRRKTAGEAEAHSTSAGNATPSVLSSALKKVSVVIDGKERQMSRQRRWQLRNRAAGNCELCKAPSDGHGYCEKHRALRREYWRAKYYRKVSTRGEE